MADITNFSKEQLIECKSELEKKYQKYVDLNLKLDMSRGKPAPVQLDLSNELLEKLDNYTTEGGIDVRNYGVLDGIPEAKELFAHLLDLDKDKIIIGGNASINLMYDVLARIFLFGTQGNTPWSKLEKIKFLCPCPGYDRHFSILNEFNIEMINIKMNEDGPDIETIKKLVAKDESIKGIICVPLYSNPEGICYSDEIVRQLATMKTAAKDFRIFWDNAYGIHHLYGEHKVHKLLNIFKEAEKVGNEDRIYYYFSTSKITFAGAGVSLLSASSNNIAEAKKHMGIQTIGYDKINQLHIVRYFKNPQGIENHMKKLAEIMRPKFDLVLEILERELGGTGLLKWKKPDGGYFITVDTLEGCAKKTVELGKKAGVVITGAGATYPYGKDPLDTNIRLAPSYPTLEELKTAIELFAVCVKLTGVNKLLEKF